MGWLKKLFGDEMKEESKEQAAALMATGKQGEATILRLDDTGMRINRDPRISLLLEVRLPGHPAYQVQKTVRISLIRISQVQVGSVIAVLADPAQPQNPENVALLLK